MVPITCTGPRVSALLHHRNLLLIGNSGTVNATEMPSSFFAECLCDLARTRQNDGLLT